MQLVTEVVIENLRNLEILDCWLGSIEFRVNIRYM